VTTPRRVRAPRGSDELEVGRAFTRPDSGDVGDSRGTRVTRRPGERPSRGGHAEERRRQFERERGLSDRRELGLDEEAKPQEEEQQAPKEEETSEEA
jgi:hypothetical protein